jgi:alpha-1,2-mannosyltransferase
MSPFFLDYDLTMMAIPLAWLLVEGLKRGFLPWEKLILGAGFLLPLVARDLALHLSMPIGPLVMIALLLACARATVWQPKKTSDDILYP